jgi:hypothetical protein
MYRHNRGCFLLTGPWQQTQQPNNIGNGVFQYLELHLDRRLTWHKHITKRKQLRITLTKMYWLLGRKSKLSTSNKLLMYKTILKPQQAEVIQNHENENVRYNGQGEEALGGGHVYYCSNV